MQKSAASQVTSSSFQQNVIANQEYKSQPTLATLFERLGSSDCGLTTQEAHQRLAKFGLNEPIRLQRTAGLRQFLVFLANPLVVILLIASIVTAALGEVLNASIIVAMVLLSIALNFVQTFRSQGFVESLATQTLVLFIIRTAGNPLRSRPSLPLAITTILVVCTGIILPFTPLAGPLGFTPLPPLYFLFLTGMIIAYLLLVEIVKRRLMSRLMK